MEGFVIVFWKLLQAHANSCLDAFMAEKKTKYDM